MDLANLLQYLVFLLIVFFLVKPLGGYMKNVFEGRATFLDRLLRPLERTIYRLGGIDPGQEMTWREYAYAFIAFSLAGTLILYVILRLQAFLPWYEKAAMTTPMTPDLAMNTAVSFVTTTTWQAYVGESTMSAFTQMVGLVGQNFLAGAAGLAVGIAFIRGFAWTRAKDLGNFWVDVTRATLWILLPCSVLGSSILVWLGVLAPLEQSGNPAWSAQTLPGGNMEGKETRFGIGSTVLTAVVTSNGATGSTNAMHDSFMPLGGLLPLVDLLLGEMVYGGLGTGIYSIVLVALVGLFIAGLMVGRTPEYLGKQIGPPEVKLMMLYTLATPFAVLIPTAWTVIAKDGLAGLTTNSGPHGFTEIFYAYASCMANNGQSFAGLSADTLFYNVSTAVVMMIGRFGLAIPALALAARFARQGRRPQTLGTLPTDTPQFATVIIGTAVIVGALSYLPALALGPIVEHLLSAPR